jgi:hypothetical protein
MVSSVMKTPEILNLGIELDISVSKFANVAMMCALLVTVITVE